MGLWREQPKIGQTFSLPLRDLQFYLKWLSIQYAKSK